MRALEGCLAGLPAGDRRVLELRAGVGRPRGQSRAAVAGRLKTSVRRVRRIERGALRRLQALGARGCGAGGQESVTAPGLPAAGATGAAGAAPGSGGPAGSDRGAGSGGFRLGEGTPFSLVPAGNVAGKSGAGGLGESVTGGASGIVIGLSMLATALVAGAVAAMVFRRRRRRDEVEELEPDPVPVVPGSRFRRSAPASPPPVPSSRR